MPSPDDKREAMLRRQAMQTCALLPENPDDAGRVLDYMRKFHDEFLLGRPRPELKTVSGRDV